MALFAAAGSPDTIVARLNQEAARVLTRDEVSQRFMNEGLEPAAGPPEQLANTIRVETARFAKLIKDADLRVR